MTITVGQLISAVQGLSSINTTALSGAVSSHLSNLQDDATVTEEVLGIIAVFWPPAGVIAQVIALDAELAPLVGITTITPDADPEVDAQTTRAFNPGDPAAKL
jgi:hypothetical protein